MNDKPKNDAILILNKIMGDGFIPQAVREEILDVIHFLRAVDILDWITPPANADRPSLWGIEENRPIIIDTGNNAFRIGVMIEYHGTLALWDPAVGSQIYAPVVRFAYLPTRKS